MKFAVKPVFLALGLLTGFSQSAAAVTFSGDLIGAFSNPVKGTGDQVYISNNDNGGSPYYNYGFYGYYGYYTPPIAEFDWGSVNPSYNLYYPSAFIFDGTGSDSKANYSVGLNTPFSLGAFTYINTPVYYANGVTGVNFNLTNRLDGVGNMTF